MVDEGEEVQVMRVVLVDLPPAISLEVVQEVARNDPVYQRLKDAVQAGRKPADRELVPYTSVWGELGVVQDLVCSGERIVVPEGQHPRYDVQLREWIVDIGHNSHQGANATKRQLRLRLWFPGMDRMVERVVSSCLPCQASVESLARDPLKPSGAPEEPWSRVFADHWGPTQDGLHILVVPRGGGGARHLGRSQHTCILRNFLQAWHTQAPPH